MATLLVASVALLVGCGPGPEVRFAGWKQKSRVAATEAELQRECEGVETPRAELVAARANSCRLFALNYERLSEGWFHYIEEACRLGGVEECGDLFAAVAPPAFNFVLSHGYSDLERASMFAVRAPKQMQGGQEAGDQRLEPIRKWFSNAEAGCSTRTQYPDFARPHCEQLAKLQTAFGEGRASPKGESVADLESILDGAIPRCPQFPAFCLAATNAAGALAQYEAREREIVRSTDAADLLRVKALVTNVCTQTQRAWHNWESLGGICFEAALLHNAIATRPEYVPPAESPITTAGFPHTLEARSLAARACTVYFNVPACTWAEAQGVRIDIEDIDRKRAAEEARTERAGERFSAESDARIQERIRAQAAESERFAEQQRTYHAAQLASLQRTYEQSVQRSHDLATGGRARGIPPRAPRTPEAVAGSATSPDKASATAADKPATPADKPAADRRILEAYAWFFQHHHHGLGKADYLVFTAPQKTPYLEGDNFLVSSQDVANRAERAIDNFLRSKDSSYRGRIGAPEEHALVGSLEEARRRVDADVKSAHERRVPAEKPQYIILLDPVSGAVLRTLVVPAAQPGPKKKGADVAL